MIIDQEFEKVDESPPAKLYFIGEPSNRGTSTLALCGRSSSSPSTKSSRGFPTSRQHLRKREWTDSERRSPCATSGLRGSYNVSQDTFEEEMRAHPNVVTSQVRLPDIRMKKEFWEQMKNSVANAAASGK